MSLYQNFTKTDSRFSFTILDTITKLDNQTIPKQYQSDATAEEAEIHRRPLDPDNSATALFKLWASFEVITISLH
jgi:hypothetical protein